MRKLICFLLILSVFFSTTGVVFAADQNTVHSVSVVEKVSGALLKTSAKISWKAVPGAQKYWIMVGNVRYAGTANTFYTLKDLKSGEIDEVYVIARLCNGRARKITNIHVVCVNTTAPIRKPVKVDGFTATVLSETSIEVSWKALPGVQKYWIMINDVCYISTTNTSYTIINRKPNRTYELYVIAKLADSTVLKKADADVISITMELPAEDPSEKIVGMMDGNYGITLDKDLPADTYTLNYEDENGIMPNCLEICTLEKSQDGTAVVYESFITQNTAPSGCTKIGVYNSENTKIGYIELPEAFQNHLSGKLYSFSATSDVHLGYSTAEEDFKKALSYFNETEKVEFNVICGDLAISGAESELQNYKALVEEYSPNTKTYVAAGNHEEFAANSSGYYEECTGNPLYYSFTRGNDVFIMVGIISTHEHNLFAEGELQWLYEVLEANRNKRCFVFQHIPVEGGSGDPLNALQGRTTKLADQPTSVAFKNLLSHYKNAIHFHGHTHFKLASQEYDKKANYDDVLGGHSVHIPSLSNPRMIDPTGNSAFLGAPQDAEGYVIDVYENGIALRGIDIINEKLIPVAQYYLDTTLQEVAANSFVDSTGIIKSS